MEKIQVVCDVCGVIKGESNHWWKVGIDRAIGEENQVAIAPASGGGWLLGTFEDQLDVCGQVCAVKKLSEWMGQQSYATPANEVLGEELK